MCFDYVAVCANKLATTQTSITHFVTAILIFLIIFQKKSNIHSHTEHTCALSVFALTGKSVLFYLLLNNFLFNSLIERHWGWMTSAERYIFSFTHKKQRLHCMKSFSFTYISISVVISLKFLWLLLNFFSCLWQLILNFCLFYKFYASLWLKVVD